MILQASRQGMSLNRPEWLGRLDMIELLTLVKSSQFEMYQHLVATWNSLMKAMSC